MEGSATNASGGGGRSFTRMQAERQKLEVSVQAKRSKNSETIGNLKREVEKMRSELNLLTVPGAGSTIQKLEEQDRLAQMKLEIDSIERRLEHEKKLGNEFNKSVEDVQMETLKMRRVMKGNNSTGDRVGAVDKQIRLLENRLDQALVDFNKALATNRSLRQRIDNLRDERDTFKQIYDKLEASLHGRKRAMAQLIEKSNEDYEMCAKAQEDLVNLEHVVEEDRQRYAQESQKLEELMTRYKAAREQQQHQLIQEKARIAAKQAEKRAAKSLRGNRRMLQQMTQGGGGGSSSFGGSGSENNNDTRTNLLQMADSPNASGKNKHHHQKDGEGGTGNKSSNHHHHGGGGDMNSSQQDQQQQQAAEDDPSQLQDIIERLKDATGVQDLDVLYQTFVQAEESNFSTFNFVNELNTERDQLESEIAGLREELANRRTESERHATLKALENELAHTETQNDATHKRTESLKETLGGIRVVAERIFNQIGCSHQEATELLGTSQCTELNMTKYFGMIENRTNAILFAYQSSTQNNYRRQLLQKDEEQRKRKEKKSGGTVGDASTVTAGAGGGDGETGEIAETATSATELMSLPGGQKPRFIGLGPANMTGTVQYNFEREHLPSCNPGGENKILKDLPPDENVPMDPSSLRKQIAEVLEKRHQEAGGKHRPSRKPKKPK